MVAVAALSAYASFLVVRLALDPMRFQWDFQTFYFAARVHLAGGDPYDLHALSAAAGHTVRLPFVYPPYGIYPFLPFSLLPLGWALQLFLALKLAALAALARQWMSFGTQRSALGLAVFGLLAFDGTLHADFATGNITIFEQLLLWMAFRAYLRGELKRFCAFVLAASAFKLTPLVFLGLLPFAQRPRKWTYFAASVSAVGAAFGVVFVMAPTRLRAWVMALSFASGEGSSTDINPSLLTLFREVGTRGSHALHIALPAAAMHLAFALVALTVAGVTLWIFLRSPAAQGADRGVVLITLACFVYVITSPRLVIYSFAILVLPFYMLAERFAPLRGGAVLVAAACVGFSTHPLVTLPGAPGAMRIFTAYHSLFLTFAAWAALLASIHLEARAARPVSLGGSISTPDAVFARVRSAFRRHSGTLSRKRPAGT
jgi:hypothetical protein